MAKDDPKTYLAANVLNESKLVGPQLILLHLLHTRADEQEVSYRMLSRDLKVHSNLAKQYVDAILLLDVA